jgi:hypothetical protein
MFAFGPPELNDVVYYNEVGLRVERTGQAVTGTIAYPGAPVSLQVQKAGNSLTFSHRLDDADPGPT